MAVIADVGLVAAIIAWLATCGSQRFAFEALELLQFGMMLAAPGLSAIALMTGHEAERGVAPNGGPGALPGNSEVTGGCHR